MDKELFLINERNSWNDEIRYPAFVVSRVLRLYHEISLPRSTLNANLLQRVQNFFKNEIVNLLAFPGNRSFKVICLLNYLWSEQYPERLISNYILSSEGGASKYLKLRKKTELRDANSRVL